jgi:membrane protease YdiL (CAAX protease family)
MLLLSSGSAPRYPNSQTVEDIIEKGGIVWGVIFAGKVFGGIAIVSVLEEVLYRGILFRALRKYLNLGN